MLIQRKFEERAQQEQVRLEKAKVKNQELKLKRTNKFYEAWFTKMMNLGMTSAGKVNYNEYTKEVSYTPGTIQNYYDANMSGTRDAGEELISGPMDYTSVLNQFRREAQDHDVPFDLAQFEELFMTYEAMKNKQWKESFDYARARGASSEMLSDLYEKDKNYFGDVQNYMQKGFDTSTEQGQLDLQDFITTTTKTPAEMRDEGLFDALGNWIGENPGKAALGGVVAAGAATKFGPSLAGRAKDFLKGGGGKVPMFGGAVGALQAKMFAPMIGEALGFSEGQSRMAGNVLAGGLVGRGIYRGLPQSRKALNTLSNMDKTMRSSLARTVATGDKATLVQNAKALDVDKRHISRVNKVKINKSGNYTKAGQAAINNLKKSIQTNAKRYTTSQLLKRKGLSRTTKTASKSLLKVLGKQLFKRGAGLLNPAVGGVMLASTIYDIHKYMSER